MGQQQKTSTSENFAAALRKARADRSQAEFARFLGIKHQQTYQAYEAGRVPSGEILQQISIKIGVSIDELLTGRSQSPLNLSLPELAGGPWGDELEEDTQFTIALSAFMRTMTADQLVVCLREILDNRVVSSKAKQFWSLIIGTWIHAKADEALLRKHLPQRVTEKR